MAGRGSECYHPPKLYQEILRRGYEGKDFLDQEKFDKVINSKKENIFEDEFYKQKITKTCPFYCYYFEENRKKNIVFY